MIRLKAPLKRETLEKLRAGDEVLIDGYIYAARDAAHKIIHAMVKRGEKLPFDISGQIIYYVGPCPAPQGRVIGSCGPTTSGRMDTYTPLLIEGGLSAMIGKGNRSKEVIDAMVKYGAVYFGAIGGTGALLSAKVTGQEVIAFPHLGPESLRRLEVFDFPVTVLIDSRGNNLYELGKKDFSRLHI